MRTGLNIKMKRVELIQKISHQRAKHVLEHSEAVAKWRLRMREMADHIAATWKKLKAYPRDLQKLSRVPVAHTEDFDRAIVMLENAVDETIELDQETFSQLVEGNWSWASEVSLSNSMYGVGNSNKTEAFAPTIRPDEVEG